MKQPLAYRTPYLPKVEEARVMPKQFGIDMQKHIDAQVDAREIANVVKAKWTLLHDGILLPVTNLYDRDGNEIYNPMRAYSVVVYTGLADKPWTTISNIDPGELWRRHVK